MRPFKLAIFSLFFSSTLFCQVDLDEGLVLYLNFENGIEELVQGNEVISYGNSVIVNDSNCSNGNSMQFDGNESFLELTGTEGYNFSDNFSISLWFKAPQEQEVFTSTANSIISKWILPSGDHDKDGYPFVLRIYNSDNPNNGQLIFATTEGLLGSCQDSERVITDQQYNDDEYHHILFGIDNNIMKVYMDCELVAEVENTLDCERENNANIFLGARNELVAFNRPNNFKGNIDEVRFYDRFVTPDELNVLCSCNCSIDLSNNFSVLSEEYYCQGSEYFVPIQNNTNELYSYSIDGVNFDSTPLISVNQVGQYELFVRDESGCDATVGFELMQKTAVQEYEICAGVGESISVNGISYSSSGEFTQLLEAENGCDSILTINVTVDLNCDDCQLTQAFSTLITLNKLDDEMCLIDLSYNGGQSFQQTLSNDELMSVMALVLVEHEIFESKEQNQSKSMFADFSRFSSTNLNAHWDSKAKFNDSNVSKLLERSSLDLGNHKFDFQELNYNYQNLVDLVSSMKTGTQFSLTIR